MPEKCLVCGGELSRGRRNRRFPLCFKCSASPLFGFLIFLAGIGACILCHLALRLFFTAILPFNPSEGVKAVCIWLDVILGFGAFILGAWAASKRFNI